MKKILLMFFGALFAAHMVYAASVQLTKKDLYSQTIEQLSVTNSADWTEVKAKTISSGNLWDALYTNNICTRDGSNNVTCDLTKYTNNNGANAGSLFANETKCTTFRNATSEASAGTCTRAESNKAPYYIKCNNSLSWDGTRKYCKHDLKVKFTDAQGNYTTTYSNVAITAQKYLDNVQNRNCMGSNSGTISCSKTDDHNISCSLTGCTASFDFWASSSTDTSRCDSYRSGTQTATGSKGAKYFDMSSTATCAVSSNTREKTFYTGKTYGNYGPSTASFSETWRAATLSCKKYYSLSNGKCLGKFTLKKTDQYGTYETSSNVETANIENQAGRTQSTSFYGGNLSCTLNSKTHTSDPNTGVVTCTCSTGSFWTEDRCNQYRKAQNIYNKKCELARQYACAYDLVDLPENTRAEGPCPAGLKELVENGKETHRGCVIDIN